MSDKERALFEAHIEKTEGSKPRLWAQVFASSPCNPAMPAHLEGVYLMRENQKAWLAWQARAALDAPVVAHAVACPHCWAKEGESCVWPDMRTSPYQPHEDRKDAAKAQGGSHAR